MKIKRTKKTREERALERDPYLGEEIRLNNELKKLKPGSDEYKEVQRELKDLNIIRAESRESKRRISKQDKGGIIIKVLGILGAGAGLGSIIWAEHKGLTFTGEKRSIMDSIARGIGNIFVKR